VETGPYRVGDDRELTPTEYDDWAEDIVRAILREPAREAVLTFLSQRISDEGLGQRSVDRFDIDGLMSAI
jgi:hypothetical protein